MSRHTIGGSARPVLLFVSVFVLAASSTFADPGHVEPKPWLPELPTHLVAGTPGFNSGCVGGMRVPCDAIGTPSNISGLAYRGWFTLYADAGNLLTVGTAPTQFGDDTDTFITLLADDCATVLTSDDDQGPGKYSLIYRFEAPYTGAYHLEVRGFSPAERGRYRTYFTCLTSPAEEQNDACQGATVLPRCEEQTITGDMHLAGNDYDLGNSGMSCTGFPSDGRDVVYALDVRRGDVVHLNYKLPQDDASMYIVTDCGDLQGTCIAASDRGLNGVAETLDWIVPESGRYFLVLDSYGLSAGGKYTLEVSMECAAVSGACCVPDEVCLVATQDECEERTASTYLGDDTVCSPFLCGATVPVREATWGSIKREYR